VEILPLQPEAQQYPQSHCDSPNKSHLLSSWRYVIVSIFKRIVNWLLKDGNEISKT
jgi:hypothetical protein